MVAGSSIAAACAIDRRWLLLSRENGRAGEKGEREINPFSSLAHSLARHRHPTVLALGWLIGLRYPFFPERGERLLPLALPPFILLVAAALDSLWGRVCWAAIATLGLVMAMNAASLAAFYLVPRYPGDDYRPLIARTVEQGLPEDTVFAIYPWQVGYRRSYGSANRTDRLLTPDADWTPGVAAALDGALARGKVWFPPIWRWARSWKGKLRRTWQAAWAAPFINEWYGPSTRLSGWSGTSKPQTVDAATVRFPLRGADGAVELIGVDATHQPIPAADLSSRSPCAGAYPRRYPSWR